MDIYPVWDDFVQHRGIKKESHLWTDGQIMSHISRCFSTQERDYYQSLGLCDFIFDDDDTTLRTNDMTSLPAPGKDLNLCRSDDAGVYSTSANSHLPLGAKDFNSKLDWEAHQQGFYCYPEIQDPKSNAPDGYFGQYPKNNEEVPQSIDFPTKNFEAFNDPPP
jgi:hypothetical protein